jgi:hypothetical protein
MEGRMKFALRGAGALCFLAALLAGGPVAAQQTTGRIQGRVTDAQTGQPLVGASVIVVGTNYGNITNEEGYYFINNVPAGVHDIQAQFLGYRTVVVEAQRVLAGQTADVSFELTPEALALEAITVQGERNPLVPRDQTQTKAIITSEVIDAVPVEDVRDVVALQPGVVETGSALGQVIRGGRPGEAAVYLDGVLVRNFAVGSQSEITLQANALEEVDVLLGGYGAEYGQAQSGVINLVSKGGGTEWSGAVSFETDQIEIENSYGYSRLEASISGPMLGEKLGISISGTAIGQEDARPTYMGCDVGRLTFQSVVDGSDFSYCIGQTRFFRPTGTFTTDPNDEDIKIADFEEIKGLGAKKPWNNADSYNLNLTVRGTPTATTRYNAGITLTRDQRRFFDPQLQFRPYALSARREKSWLVRGGLEQVLFQGAESGATIRINVGYGQDEFAQGPLGESLADTLAVLKGDKYPMEGDFLGFTFADFRFPFEGLFTMDKALARLAEMRENPSRNPLVPLETVIDPETNQPYTLDKATELFDLRYGPDNPFGIQDFLQTGLPGYGWRTEKTLSLRVDLDWQANRWNRIGLGAEVYKKDIENLTGFGSGIGGLSLVSPTFQNVYTADPIIAGFYAKDRLDLGEVVVELGARLDYFKSDMLYPKLPGFSIPIRQGEQVFTPEFVEQEPQLLLSPRLGVGFPVTENTQFRLSYGHFTQVPPLNHLFSGVNADLTKVNANATFGRPIEFGRTIGYEVGITHSFDPQTVLDISAYSREKQGDIAYRVANLQYPVGQRSVRFLTNGDFGYVRGADARLGRRFSNLLNVQLAYSLLDTRSTGADPQDYLRTLGRQTDPVTGEALPPAQAAYATSFDQTHTISLSGVMTTPQDFLAENPFANTLLRDLTASVAFQARSGLPYTRTRTEGATSNINGPDPVFVEPVNASRMPWTYTSNLRLGRDFAVGSSRMNVYVSVRNLLNHKNVGELFTITRSPLVPGPDFLRNNTLGTSRGVFDTDIVIAEVADPYQRLLLNRREQLFGNRDGVLDRREQHLSSIASFVASGYGTQLDIITGAFFDEPRQIRLGVEWRF